MFAVLLDVLLPMVFVLAAVMTVGPRVGLRPEPISQAAFWLFAPCLVFHALVVAPVALVTVQRVVVVPVAVALCVWCLGEGLARVFGLDPRGRDLLLCGAVLTNAGNLGLPVAFFRWGDEGVAIASVVVVGTSFVSSTAGVWLAARGSPQQPDLRRLLTVPVLWAGLGGLLLKGLEVAPPDPLLRAIGLLGQAAVPCLLTVLGLQLVRLERGLPEGIPGAGLATAVLARLVLAPLLATLFTGWLGLEESVRDVVIVLLGMPTAVFAVVLATEFDTAPRAAAFVVAATTVGAAFTVPLWMTWVS